MATPAMSPRKKNNDALYRKWYATSTTPAQSVHNAQT
jgi:hypothetical protein